MKGPVKLSLTKKSSIEWCKHHDVAFGLSGLNESYYPDEPILEILDADGWDRKNFEESFKEEITDKEFRKRCSASTCGFYMNRVESFNFFYAYEDIEMPESWKKDD